MGLLFAFALGVVLAIAIPTYRRLRVYPREQAALDELGQLQRAMHEYSSFNEGLYDSRLTCLTRAGEGCFPGQPPLSDALEATVAASDLRHAFRFTFVPGPPPKSGSRRSSPTSVTSYCYAATPERSFENWAFSARSFAVDDTGRTCLADTGQAISCSGGHLPRTCTTLE